MRRVVGGLAALFLWSGMGGSVLALPMLDYNFTVQPTSGGLPNDVAEGTLQTDNSGNVLSGTMTVFSSSDANGAVGTWEIIGSVPDLGPGVGYGIDNILFPGNAMQYLDGDGLAFGPVDVPGGDRFLNIWGNGGSDYAFYGATATNGYGIANSVGLTFTLTPVLVPEPASLTMLGFLCAALFFAARRRRGAKLN